MSAPSSPYPVSLTCLAERDIERARNWYNKERPGLGWRFVEAVAHSIARISENPRQFQAVLDDIHRAPVGRFPYGLFYRIEPDGSVVIACLHSRRQPGLARRRAPRRKPEP